MKVVKNLSLMIVGSFVLVACSQDSQQQLSEAQEESTEALKTVKNEFGDNVEEGFNQFMAESRSNLEDFNSQLENMSDEKQQELEATVSELEAESKTLEKEFQAYLNAAGQEREAAEKEFLSSYEEFKQGLNEIGDMFKKAS